MKRQAVDRPEGEPRSKRKRVDHGSAMSRKADKSTADDDYKSSVRRFRHSIPLSSLNTLPLD